MRVVKILNNNYILVEDVNGNECIVMGKGLRFSNQVGSELKEENVQKIFALKDKKSVGDWQQIFSQLRAQEELFLADASDHQHTHLRG